MLKKMVALTCAMALSTGAAWVHAEELKTAPPPFAVKVEIKPAAAPQSNDTSAPQAATQTVSEARTGCEKIDGEKDRRQYSQPHPDPL